MGYTPEEVMRKNLVKEFVTDEYKIVVQAVLDEALRGKETANFEFPLITNAGVRLEVLLNATTRKDEQGNIIGVAGIGECYYLSTLIFDDCSSFTFSPCD